MSNFGGKYFDRWGDVWVRIGLHHVVRSKDGNIGGWFNGKGLVKQ